ncbi:MAG TPA: TonB-dependent receptor [Gammaproteobacteria bacterium]|nr:TonB-dependent receptor [Gammaproteobacteria bacterium]
MAIRRLPACVGASLFIGSALPTPSFAQSSQENAVDQIVVTGTPRRTSAEEMAQPVTVLSGAALERAQGLNLGETLAAEPGVSASYFGAGASRPIIRGLAGTRVRTMEDGIDTMDVSTISVDHAVGIDTLAAEQIEVFRGPTTLLYGSGAVGGVVNTVTRRIPEKAPDRPFEGDVELRGDSALGERGGAVRLDGGGERFAWHVDGSHRTTDDYEIPGPAVVGSDERPGTLPNSDLNATSGAVGASWIGDNAFFGGSVSHFETNYGSPTEEDVRVDLHQDRVDLKGGWTGLSGALEAVNVRFGSNDYEHVELEGGEPGTTFKNRGQEARIELLTPPMGAWRGTFGTQLQDRQFEAIGEESFVPPVDTKNLGLFAIEQRDLDQWSVSLGGRVEHQRQEPTTPGLPDVDDNATSLSFSGLRKLGNGVAFALNAALAQRLPVAEELYAFGPHIASGSFEIGDPTLGKETSHHLDVGVRKTAGKTTWGVTAFYTDFANFTFPEATGENDEESGLPIFVYIQRAADFHGLEAELSRAVAEVGPGEIDVRVFTDYTVGRLAGGEHVPRMPPLRYGARVQYHTARLLTGLEATRYDEQNKLGAFETPTDGYTMVNADFGWAVTKNHALHLFVKGSNLLDEDARRSTSLVKDFAPLPGRSYAIGIRTSF